MAREGIRETEGGGCGVCYVMENVENGLRNIRIASVAHNLFFGLSVP